ncbi:MAG: hypothetical protein A3K19_14535 [Lentisphaerae bacterium RIFOXYB12_FULL_65_16]|nr:MAG: hypothetical protein A3K18_18580 [Lentisphaerae bacterium RIFOXYA12_64_32]OGV87478.1 MAG: hypothetical protein A3K19_14535 [Lentisphaerae bacterium RIFOXYB12_FULL_65_16]
MPAGDGTGPMGMGPMSGRAAGVCAGFGVPGYMNPVGGRGFGMGFGPATGLRAGRGGGFGARGGRGGCGGRGWRNRFYATGLPGWARGDVPQAAAPAPEQELTLLKQHAEHVGNALEVIRKRIEEMETKPAEK